MEVIELWIKANSAITIQVFIVVFVALLANFIIQKALKNIDKHLRKTKTPWDNVLAQALTKPVAYLVALLGLSASINIVNQGMHNSLLEKIDSYRGLLILVLIAWFLIRFVRLAESILAERMSDDPQGLTTMMAVARLLRAAIIITVILMAMQALGYSIEGVLAFGGVGGLAVGFAAKDLLSNFFGGLVIYLDRPFVVGDWIRSPDRNIEGTVENIGWRLTQIRTFDKRPLYVPNSVFVNIALENPSRMSNRRIKETIGLRYNDAQKVKLIIDDVRTMLEQHPDIDQRQTLMVNFDVFGASSLDFFIYTFTKTTNWVEFHKIKQDVLIKVLDIVTAHGAEVAFPTSTIFFGEQSATELNSAEPTSAKLTSKEDNK